MMGGMLLAIVTYRPIFSTFLNDTSITKWIGGNPERKGELKIIKGINASTRDSTLTYKQVYTLGNGNLFTRVEVDTVFANKAKNVSTSKPFYENKHLSSQIYWKFVFLVFILILYVTMAYGPVAAFLVELFPTKIRYTSMSLPYHIGNGVFGGLVPFIGLLLTTTYTSDPLVGLWYPIAVAALCFVIGVLYLNNKIDKNINN